MYANDCIPVEHVAISIIGQDIPTVILLTGSEVFITPSCVKVPHHATYKRVSISVYYDVIVRHSQYTVIIFYCNIAIFLGFADQFLTKCTTSKKLSSCLRELPYNCF